jgi:hypothetical protein
MLEKIAEQLQNIGLKTASCRTIAEHKIQTTKIRSKQNELYLLDL